jgi:Domain of unknown function (DUF4920)
MRYLVYVLLIILGSASGFAVDGTTYGKKLTVTDVTPIADIVANPEKFEGRRVLVQGTVDDVCKKMGCWMTLRGDEKDKTIRIKVKDGEIVFPQDARGKTARAQGVVTVRTMTKEQLIAQGEHMAEEQGTSFDPSTVTGPRKVVQITGESALILGEKSAR